MDTPANYLHWAFINISVPNAALIAAMLIVFGLALVLPFPRHGETVGPDDER